MSEIVKPLMLDETGILIAEAIKKFGAPSDAQAEKTIKRWLDEHPEATTSVQDKSLTDAKFSDALKFATLKDYVIPEMFGAKGDGVTDDTQAFKDMLENNTAILIPNGTYLITEPLYMLQGTQIEGCGQHSIIKCNSDDGLFMVNGECHIRDLRIEVDRLTGAVFKINEESLSTYTSFCGALGIVIDNILIFVTKEIGHQSACFQISGNDYHGDSGTGFWGVQISNIFVKSKPEYNLGYFFKSFIKGSDKTWITGIDVSNCTIYAARWGFFLSESDGYTESGDSFTVNYSKIFDTSVLKTVDHLTVSRVQMQKHKKAVAFVYVPRDRKVTLDNCIPWDWSSSYKDLGNVEPYLVDMEMLNHRFSEGSGLHVFGNDSSSLITSFAGIDAEGNKYRLYYDDYEKLRNIGTDYRPANLMAKVQGMTDSRWVSENGKYPKAQLLYKGSYAKSSITRIHFQQIESNVPCNIMIERKEDGTVRQIMDKDTTNGIRFGYKIDETDNKLYLYVLYSGNSKRFNGMFRSIELSNSDTCYDAEQTYANHNKTIDIYFEDEERFYAEVPEGVTVITDIIPWSFPPILTSPNGKHYRLIVGDDGVVSTEEVSNLGWAEVK